MGTAASSAGKGVAAALRRAGAGSAAKPESFKRLDEAVTLGGASAPAAAETGSSSGALATAVAGGSEAEQAVAGAIPADAKGTVVVQRLMASGPTPTGASGLLA